MSKNVNLDLKSILPQLRKYQKLLSKHAVFTAVLVVLLAYVFMVWKIGQLATATPDPSQTAATTTKIPTVDKTAIKQIQTLEQSNTNVQTLLDNARNNPFQE